MPQCRPISWHGLDILRCDRKDRTSKAQQRANTHVQKGDLHRNKQTPPTGLDKAIAPRKCLHLLRKIATECVIIAPDLVAEGSARFFNGFLRWGGGSGVHSSATCESDNSWIAALLSCLRCGHLPHVKAFHVVLIREFPVDEGFFRGDTSLAGAPLANRKA